MRQPAELPEEQQQPGEPQHEPPAPKRQRGGGGAWRAYLHLNGANLGQGVQSVLEIAARYHQLSVEERVAYEALGAAGPGLS